MGVTPGRVESSRPLHHYFVGLGTARVLIGYAMALALVLSGILVTFPRTIAQASSTTWESWVDSANLCSTGNALMNHPSLPLLDQWSITTGSNPARVTFPGGDTFKIVNDCVAGQETLRVHNLFGANPMKVNGSSSSWVAGSGNWAGKEYFDLPFGQSLEVTFTQAGSWGTLAHLLYNPGDSSSQIGVDPGIISYPVLFYQYDFDLFSTAPPAITPASQTVYGTVRTAISATTAFTATDFTGAVSYTSGTLPAGLSLDASTGVISGTPTAVSTATVTITATGATAGTATATITFAIVQPAIVPATQTVSGTADSAITATAAFAATDFTGAVTYAVTSGTLPAGLTLNASTGVVSGTPTTASTAAVTITATGATAGTATATVTFAIEAAPATTTTTAAPTTTTAPTTTAAAPATTTTAPANTPTLVNSTNREALTRTPGAATALVNGQVVTVEVVSQSDNPAARTSPEDRTPAQIAELQAAADEMVGLLDEVAGGESGVEVVDTGTGAELSGVFPDENVPVEDVIVVDIDESATLFAARDANGDIVEVEPGAVLEVTPEGEVAVLAFGLPVGDQVELVLMSTPTLLGTFTVDANGSIETRANVPDTIGSGDHTLVVASPNVQASLGLKLADASVPAATTLPATGWSPATGIVVTVLALGGLLALTARRRRDVIGG